MMLSCVRKMQSNLVHVRSVLENSNNSGFVRSLDLKYNAHQQIMNDRRKGYIPSIAVAVAAHYLVAPVQYHDVHFLAHPSKSLATCGARLLRKQMSHLKQAWKRSKSNDRFFDAAFPACSIFHPES